MACLDRYTVPSTEISSLDITDNTVMEVVHYLSGGEGPGGGGCGHIEKMAPVLYGSQCRPP